ncbi:MAG: hypothetical protein P1U75_18240 [Antarcticimicrobium sp.]|uniref:hypothetical protein n=1 Tax=Antarcticimicrobium sp. TaxID=2824147 RepID=UPI0026234BD0|nr:hypothetical protein [Antarcticimicrobium sp.]MDF1718585.1 hypothetical protein [Antarcticimicrobium sp.]
MRVLLHAGFHKTGTSTVQQALFHNRDALAPHLRLVPRARMAPAGKAARAWSAGGNPVDLALFGYELAQVMEEWDADDPRPMLISAEDLCGQMPGRAGVESYAAAAPLMRTVVDTLATLHPNAAPAFYFSTRQTEDWLASAHAQHLRASRMTLSAEAFAGRYRAAADLATVVDGIAAALAPLPVHRCALEQSRARPLGPLDPLLDLLALPEGLRDSLEPQPPVNPALPPDCLQGLLVLNRSDLDDAALRAAKRALIAECV